MGSQAYAETDKENARQSIFESRGEFEKRIWDEALLLDRKALKAMLEYETSGVVLPGLTRQ